MQPRFELLGQFVENDWVYTDGAKIENMRNEVSPTNRTQFRSFSALSSYCRKFIKLFARIELPLTDNMKESVEYA